MIELYENISSKEADLCSLVLTASFIPHRVKRQDHGYAIYVDDFNYDRARHAIGQYFSENRSERSFAEKKEEPVHGYAGLWIAALLGGFHFWVQGTDMIREIWTVFGASAIRIVEGELYRTITALTLHADSVHLVGNMVGMAVFGTAVAQITGWGLVPMIILLTGAFGNYINAIVQQDAHLSIGASTAVFGAVGILSACQFVRRRKKGGRRSKAWVPILGGVALLGLLGGGEHVDLGAHLFGFAAGIAAGVIYSVAMQGPTGNRTQWISALAASGVVVFSWLAGYLSM